MAVERIKSAAKNRVSGARKRKPTISIIGAGRMGTALALALASRGYPIEAVAARRKSHARACAEMIGTQPLILSSAQLGQLPSSDILFITTPDDAIESTASQLAAIMKSRVVKMKEEKGRSKRTALHASGALSSSSLRSLREVGFSTGSMHPLISVSDPLHGAESLCSAFFCIEGESAAQSVARSLVDALGAESFSINTKDKALYHAAAVMASGHMTALFDIAMEMLAHCGLTKNRARAVLLPLLRSTLENLYTSDPAHALTGTFARADTSTVRRHLEAISSSVAGDALAVYTLLGLRSLQLAKRAGASSEALKEIALILAGAKM
ncbi:MAG: hypothetical protein QOJ02_3427 [Acidobacteriota bacterium]|jgi:predicted short-subunit dehydrogenase-like oxidoreductase (DUF2520 family)|nr:hypothetical protein [Acidobacteriota bacterium]